MTPSSGSQGHRTDWLRYACDPAPVTYGHGYGEHWNCRQESQRVDWDGRWRTEDQSEFDGVGHYRSVEVRSDYGSPVSFHRTYTQYNPSQGTYPSAGYQPWPVGKPWILGTYTMRWSAQGSGMYRRDYAFDGQGFLQRERIYRDTGVTQSAHDVIREWVRDSQGNVIRERSYGGDVQSVPLGALASLGLGQAQGEVVQTWVCGSLATRKHAASSLFQVRREIECSSGRVSREWDISGLVTEHTWDVMGRLRWSLPQAGHGPRVERAYYGPVGDGLTPELLTYPFPKMSGSSAIVALSFGPLPRAGGSWRNRLEKTGQF